MSKRTFLTFTVATAVVSVGLGAFTAAQVTAADQESEALAAAKKMGITEYEKEGEAGGGGAPQKVLLDNDKIRVNLVSFPAGFNRAGRMMRRNDQLLVYIDPGDFTLTWSGGSGKPIPPSATPRKPLPPGSIAWHPRGTVVSDSHINNAYRVMFVELKK